MTETIFLTYSAFVEMFDLDDDFSAYENDEGIEILVRTVPCKNPAREAGGWCAFLWKPNSEEYDGKWMRQEFNGSSPFALWWCEQGAPIDDDDLTQCSECGWEGHHEDTHDCEPATPADEEEEENDNGRACQRCGRTTCPSDDAYPFRLLWNSNKTGKEICRCCVAVEDNEDS